MVEGPGCTNNGVRARAHVGRRVVAIVGQASTQVSAQICGLFLAAVWTLGKELWLIFQDKLTLATKEFAVRIHFGMSGSLLMDGARPKFGGRDLTLGIRYEQGGILDCFGTTVSLDALVAQVRSKCERLQKQDVCVDERIFSTDACMNAIASKPTALIADVLLDQSVLPGAGNIIKNEALHRARVLPSRRVQSLNEAEIRRLVEEVRDFSMRWLRSGRAPASIIYNKTACGECGGAVNLQKLGEAGLSRATFWCAHCCSNVGNSCMTTGMEIRAAIAKEKAFASEIVRDRSEGIVFYGDASLDMGIIRESAERKRRSWRLGTINHAGSSEQPSKRMCATPQSIKHSGTDADYQFARANTSTSSNGAASTLAVASQQPVSNRFDKKPTQSQNASKVVRAANNGFQFHQESTPRVSIFCAKHGSKSLSLKRVRKDGINNSRLFFTCRGAGCSFFEWADTHFPKCNCQSTPQAVLRVSKKEGSGGRWFFACRGQDSTRRCNFFAWASPTQLQPLQSLLNPLT